MPSRRCGILLCSTGLVVAALAWVSWLAGSHRGDDPPADDALIQLPQLEGRFGQAVYADGELLVDYQPEPMLVTPRNLIERAKFPVIDAHCHWSLAQNPAAMLAAMDRHNIAYAVNLSGGEGEALAALLDRFDDPRFIHLCNLDFSRAADPDFAEYVRQSLDKSKRLGARGLKVFKSLGLTTRDAEGNLVAIDDERLDVVWRTCGDIGFAVLIHSADPAAFFRPVDGRNERWMQLRRNPDWSFHGPEFPAHDEVLRQRDAVVARHPQTTFIVAHIGEHAEDLAAAAERLERFPNMVMDLSGRVAELGRQPYAARRFLIEQQDRILFGTDRYPGRVDQPRYRVYFRFLETADEYFDYHEHPYPPTGEWKIYGMHLPHEVLRKIYHGNAARVLGLTIQESEPGEERD